MKSKLEKYLNRTSVRSFTNEKMSKEELELIAKVINNAPTSTNTQQFSAIIVTDQEKKEFISKGNFGQQHIIDAAAFIVFVADRTRILEVKPETPSSKEMLIHDFGRAIVDATIAATYAQDALIELGYGVTFVGGIQSFGDELGKELNLPDSAFVVVGLSIGKPLNINPIKPKMDKVFINEYNVEKAKKEFWKYNEETKGYFSSINYPTYEVQTRQMIDGNGNYSKPFTKSGEFLSNKLKSFK